MNTYSSYYFQRDSNSRAGYCFSLPFTQLCFVCARVNDHKKQKKETGNVELTQVRNVLAVIVTAQVQYKFQELLFSRHSWNILHV